MKKRHLLLCLVALFCVTSVSAQKKVAFVYQPGYGSTGYTPETDPIHIGLKTAFTVTDHGYASTVEANYDSLANYDLVVLSEAISGNTTLSNNLVKLVGRVPILSMKAFNYTSGRWSWAKPANPDARTSSVTINPDFETHAIFKDLVVTDNVVQIFDGTNTTNNQIQGFSELISTGLIQEANIIAKVTGSVLHAIHEIKDEANKPYYMLIPISSDAIRTVTANGVKLVVNACNYLMGGTGGFDPSAPYRIAYLFDSSYSTYPGIDEDPIFISSVLGEKDCEAIDIKDFTAANTDTLTALESYDLVVVSEAISSGHAFAKLLSQLVNRVPMLNFKSFFYKNTVWDWGAGANPSSTKTAAGVPTIKIDSAYLDHPLFENIEMPDSTITLFNTYEGIKKNMVQGYTAKAGGLIAEDPVLATVTGPAGTYNAIHEHGTVNKYLLLPISCDTMAANLSDDAYQLINNAVYYLLQSAGNVLPAVKPTLSMTYGNGVTYVTMSSLTEEAQIRYTTDGTEPTATSTLYSTQVEITTPCTIKAAAFKQGYDMSGVASIEVDVRYLAATPTISVAAAAQGKTITLAAAAGARIYYTTNGATPDSVKSTLYVEPFTVVRPGMVKAVAVEAGKLYSLVAEESISIDGYIAREKTLVWADFNTNPSKWTWGDSDTIPTKNVDLFGGAGYPYTDSLALNDCKNGFIVGTKGQRVTIQTMTPGQVVQSGNYSAYTEADFGASKMALTFLRTNVSTDPTTAFIMTNTAYTGPFDVVAWFTGAKGNSTIEKLEVSVNDNLNDTTWTVLDTLTSVNDKYVRKGVAYYDQTAPVYVKLRSVSNLGTNSNMVIFDIKLMGEGQDVSIRKPALDRQVVSTRYYNLAGQPMKTLGFGLNIVRTIYSDGSVETTKVMLNERR
ncbi:MAG: hypothetical protein GXY09_09845 [Bacteroidales bacterium]|nr:hypothetical protein [Bacteroidales bacterium]